MAAKMKKIPNPKDMTEEQLKTFLSKKRECDTKAQKIVIELLDTPISETIFLQYLPHINRSHYEDITVERAIIKSCGYPLCTKNLSDKIPKQTYKICSRNNKVYDISTRKNFCSNQCYKASSYVQDQLMTSPLWFRDKEDLIKFKLLPLTTEVGLVGEIVDISITEKISAKEKLFTGLLDFTEMCLDEIESESSQDANVSSGKDIKSNKSYRNEEKVGSSSKVSSEKIQTEAEKNVTNEKPSENKLNTPKKANKQIPILLGDIIEKKSPKVDPIIVEGQKLKSETDKKTAPQKNSAKETSTEMSLDKNCSAVVLHIEKSFGEWVGIETLIFILGKDKLKEIVADKGDEIKEYLEKTINDSTNTLQSSDQYQKLCRKLNLLDLEEKKYDQGITGNASSNPLPNYAIIKEEGKLLNVKVKAYFKGETDMPIEKNEETDKAEDDNEDLFNFPTLEKTSQHVMRRKIFLASLDKVLPDILKALCISSREISGDVWQLIVTFDLQAHNIMFKRVQWNLIAIVMIKLLSLKNQRLADQINDSTYNKHLQLLLLSYKLDFGYLNRLTWWLTDVDRIIKRKQ